MKVKRIITMILALCFMASCFPFGASAAQSSELETLIAQLPEVSDPLGTEYYFYDQLSDIEKVLYWKMSKATWDDPMITISGVGAYTQEELYASATRAWTALVADDPEYHMYWERWSLQEISFENGVYTFSLIVPQGTSDYLIRKSEARIQQIVETVGQEGDLYSRIRDLLELMHREMDYERYHPFSANAKMFYNDSAIGCFAFDNAVCAGFSDAVKILCDELNIPCIVVGNAGHAWNFVRMENGQWYSVDASADVSFDGHSLNISGKTTPDYANNSNYWLSDFYIAHAGDFSFPDLAEDAYVYNGTYAESYHEATGFEEPDPTFAYQVNDDGVSCTITAYEGVQEGDLIVPDEIDGYVVTAIGEAAFYRCDGFTGSLVIPDTVKAIEADAFQSCSGITGELVLSASLEKIGAHAFLGNEKMTGALVFPDTLQEIGRCAFWNCSSLSGDITLPEGIQLGDEVFGGCSGLTGTLYLPASFVWNGNVANGTNISAFQVSELNEQYTAYDGVLYSKDMKTLLACPGGKSGSLLIPEGVEIIDWAACYHCDKLTGELTLPQSLKEIGAFAFQGTGFTGDLVIPDGVDVIGEWAFSGTVFDGELILPDGLARIEEGTFWGQQFSGTLVLPESVEYIGDSAFESTKFSCVVISDRVNTIAEGAFSYCQEMTELTIGAGVSNICDGAFLWCIELETIHFTGDAPVIAANSFDSVVATAYYPANNDTWTEEVMQQYGGTVTWEPYETLNGWVQKDGVWYYYEGNVKQTGWLKDGGYWYYLNADGVMQTGWVRVNGNWFYMNKSGVMQTGWVKVSGKWYYMASGGAMQKGWITVNGYRYYLDSKGVMQIGWVQLDGNWYYMSAGGVMQTGWVYDGSYWYYMDTSGIMQKGWITVNGKWYYLNKSGVMVTGWLKDGGYWYYLGSDGAMLTGTHTINGKTYTFNSHGVWVA